MISAEDSLPFQWTPGRATAGWDNHLKEKQVNWVLGQRDGASLPELGLLSEGGLSGCLPTQLPGDLTAGLAQAEAKLKQTLKLESDRA